HLPLGHAWLQYGEQISDDTRRGNKVRCTCLVKRYNSRTTDNKQESRIGLYYPEKVEVLRAINPPAAAPPAASSPEQEPGRQASERGVVDRKPEADDPIELALEIKRLAKRCGGYERLRAWIDLLS